MAKKSRKQPVDTYPDPGYHIRANFLAVEDPNSKASKQAKGVLEMLQIRKPSSGSSGDIKLRFLSSDTYSTHSDLLRAASYDIGTQPIMDVNWEGMPFNIAARYTARPGKKGPLEIALMMDGITGSVEHTNGYTELRRTVALACGIAVVKQEYRRDPGQAGIELNVVNNFMGNISTVPFTARNLQDLATKL